MAAKLRTGGFRAARIALMLAGLFGGPALAAVGQDVAVDQAQQASAAGRSTEGSLDLFSILGPSGPTGTTSGGDYSLASGARALLSPDIAQSGLFHQPPESVESGDPLTVTIDVDIPGFVRDVELFFRTGGRDAYVPLEMLDDDNDERYVATIPDTSVTTRGLAYFFVARNFFGESFRSPTAGTFSVPVHISAPGLISPEPTPGGTEASAYRLISVPLNLDAPDPEDVLADDFGPYDSEVWRFFSLAANQTLAEYGVTGPMTPGKAFWLISRDAGTFFNTGGGISLPIDVPRAIVLNPGWNLVGNPFDFEIPIENLSLNGIDQLQVRRYEGLWNDPINDAVAALRPFSGYAVFNPMESTATLFVDPFMRETTAGKFGAEARAGRLAWHVRISASSGAARDAGNVAALSDGSENGWDPLDFTEPPPVGSFVALYFPHPEWKRVGTKFSTDVRPANSDGATWSFEVVGATNRPVELSFGGIRNVPASFDVFLVDDALGVTQNLRRDPTYSLATVSGVPRRLQLVVTSGASIQEWTELPERLELSPVFPNPFNRAATISYGLPEPSHVAINVYSVTGKLVATVEDAFRSEGYHSMVWDGTSSNGTMLPSGLYILHLRVGTAGLSRRVTIVR